MKNTQYLRKCELIVADASGAGIDLSSFAVQFTVRQAELTSPKNLQARIYNLSSQTSKRIQQEFTRVTLKAGYQDGNYGIVFQGDIKYFHRGRENATDTYLDIFAADADAAFNFAVVNHTCAAQDSSVRAQIDVLLGSLAEHGVSEGFVTDLPTTNLPRGKTMYGSVRDVLREICAGNNLYFNIDNGKLNITGANEGLPDGPVTLTSKTGLIGRPEQTPDGITVRALLNANLRAGAHIRLDNASINQDVAIGGSAQSGEFIPFNQRTGFNYRAAIDNDGLYRILYATHTGHTRGGSWYTDMICISPSDRLPSTIVQRGLA